jgi:hypothetical protein
VVLALEAQSRLFFTPSTRSDNLKPITERLSANSVLKKLQRIKNFTSLWGGRRQAGGIRAIARSTMALCLLGHPSLACTAAAASEDINTTAVYTDFLVRKKKWLQDGADEVIWLKIHIRWTVGQFYY